MNFSSLRKMNDYHLKRMILKLYQNLISLPTRFKRRCSIAINVIISFLEVKHLEACSESFRHEMFQRKTSRNKFIILVEKELVFYTFTLVRNTYNKLNNDCLDSG